MSTQKLILWIFVTLVMLLAAWPIGALMVLHMLVYLIFSNPNPATHEVRKKRT